MTKATILLVDDEPEVLRALRAGLARGVPELRILTAPDPVVALEVLAQERVDVILSDQRMPRMDGAEFLSRAADVAPDATRLMLTAHASFRLAERALNEGRVRFFLQKPYRLPDLVDALRMVLAERREQGLGDASVRVRKTRA